MSGAVQVYTPAPHAPSLLPSASTDWSLAHSLVEAARRPLPAHLVSDVWNPATCPLDLIPYQCAGLGLEIWDDSWPEAKQRAIYADLWRLKRNKTKLKGLKGYLELVDARLVSAHRPRDAVWLVPGLTPAERAAQMAAMPQIRIHPVRPVAARAPAAFVSGRFTPQFLCGRALSASDAAELYAGRAEYVDGALDVPVTLRGIDDPLGAATTVAIGAPASVAEAFAGGRGTAAFLGRAALFASDAAERVLTIVPDAGAPSFAVPAGLLPSTVRPVPVAETAAAKPGQAFVGRTPVGAGAAMASDALDHVYDQVTLFDPARTVPGRTPYSFVGACRLQRKPFTAEVLIDVPLRRAAGAAAVGQPVGGCALAKADLRPFWQAVAAVRAAKASRDFVWISTRLYEPINFSAGLRFGDPGFARFGDTRTAR